MVPTLDLAAPRRIAGGRLRRSAGLLVLEVETDQVPAEVRVGNLYGGDEPFPHVYGPIPVQAVDAVRRLGRTGRSTRPDGT